MTWQSGGGGGGGYNGPPPAVLLSEVANPNEIDIPIAGGFIQVVGLTARATLKQGQLWYAEFFTSVTLSNTGTVADDRINVELRNVDTPIARGQVLTGGNGIGDALHIVSATMIATAGIFDVDVFVANETTAANGVILGGLGEGSTTLVRIWSVS